VDVVAGALCAFAAVKVAQRSSDRVVEVPLRLSLRLGAPGGSRKGIVTLGLLFALTGAAALLAEQAFEKLLGALLGASTPAAAVVLAVYFLGLTLGAGLYGALSRRIESPLSVYALLEGGVAAWALFLVVAYESLIRLLSPVFALGLGSPVKLQVLRAAVACGWILPPTLLMGASFPAVVDSLDVMRVPEPKRTMSIFYALNLLGAVLGAVLGPYAAFPWLGVDGTLILGAVIDAGACIAAYRLSLEHGSRVLAVDAGARVAKAPAGAVALLLVSLASGFVLFSLEVLWTHLMGATLGNSVYSFAAMLALVLLGLLLGGVLAARAFQKEESVPAWAVGGACSLGGLLLGVQGLLWPRLPARLSLAGPHITTFFQAEVLRWFHAGVQILPSACVLGFVYPALFRLREFPAVERARFAGWVGAVNAVGCSAGALITGFVLIPRLGSQRSLALLALVCTASGAVSSFSLERGRVRLALLAIAGLSGLLLALSPRWDLLALTSGEHVYLKRTHVLPGSKLVFFHEDTFGGVTTVVEDHPGGPEPSRPARTLLTNGKFQGNDAGETTAQLAFALVPVLYTHGFDRACVIGLGTGQSASVPVRLGFSHVEIAELSPGVVRGSQLFAHLNGSLLERPSVRLWLEDGRNLMLLRPDLRCDLITMEISSVWFAGSTNLYSREFYELARTRLGARGVLQQWIQVHHIGMPELGSVIATVRSVFPHVTFWVLGGQGILVASMSPLEASLEGRERFVRAAPGFGMGEADARALVEQALASRVLDDAAVSALVARSHFTLNTDRNRHLEYATARYNVSRVDHAAQNVLALTRAGHGMP
jgi:spermidine synthase